MDVHRFFGAALTALDGVPARDLTPSERALALAVHGDEAVHLRWTNGTHAPLAEIPAPPTEES